MNFLRRVTEWIGRKEIPQESPIEESIEDPEDIEGYSSHCDSDESDLSPQNKAFQIKILLYDLFEQKGQKEIKYELPRRKILRIKRNNSENHHPQDARFSIGVNLKDYGDLDDLGIPIEYGAHILLSGEVVFGLYARPYYTDLTEEGKTRAEAQGFSSDQVRAFRTTEGESLPREVVADIFLDFLKECKEYGKETSPNINTETKYIPRK